MPKNSPQERRQYFLDKLNRKSIDAAIITDPRHVYYFTGYSTVFFARETAILILTSDHDNYLFVNSGFFSFVRGKEGATSAKKVFEDRVSVFVDYDLQTRMIAYQGYVAKELSKFLSRSKILRGKKVIGLENWHIPLTYFEAISKVISRSRCREISNLILYCRRTKGNDELANLREAARRLDMVFQTAKNSIEAGKSEMELCRDLTSDSILKYGPYEGLSRGGNWLSGERTLEIGGPPSERRFVFGDGVLLDLVALCNNYWADGARTYIVGKPSQDQEHIFNIILSAKEKGEEVLRPGTMCRDVYNAVAGEIEKAGYIKLFPHHAGHGIGLEVQEGPFFIPACKEELREGDVVTLEPGIYHPKIGGFRHEDMYIITRDGHQKITTSSSKLEEVGHV
jgi:Xaa-Pro dipeptidase